MELKPSRLLPKPCWKTSTSTPYAAATDSRLSRIALTAITSERNATSISANASRSTKATTIGVFDFSSSAWSFHCAVRPVTPASVFGRVPSVAGMITSRNSASDSFEAASVPLPSIGTVMFATVASLLTATVIGSYIRPLASARCSNRPIALRTDGAFTFGACTTTLAGSAVPGNACCIRSYVLTTVSDFGNVSGPGVAMWSWSAGAASASMSPPAASADSTGRRRTRSTIAPQIRPSPSSRRSRPTSGTRSRSTPSPSFESKAGRTVSEPSTATATTRIVARPSEANVASPVRNMPAIATITVSPEMSTERPEVAAAAASAAWPLRPAARSWRSRFR